MLILLKKENIEIIKLILYKMSNNIYNTNLFLLITLSIYIIINNIFKE